METLYIILLYSALYAFTMKLADLLNEHGLRLFKGDAIVFGFIWGALGALIVYNHVALANIIVAMNLAFLVRGSLDYLNHRIATSIIVSSFILMGTVDVNLFLTSLGVFILFGILEDKSHLISKKNKSLGTLCDIMLYYPILGLGHYVIYKDLVVLFSLTIFMLVYCITKYAAKSAGYK